MELDALLIQLMCFLWLLLDRHPDTVAAAVEQYRFQLVRTLCITAEGLGVHVEVPLGARKPELISIRGRISRRCVDRCVAVYCVGVLDRLKRLDSSREWHSVADGGELHRNRAVQFERPNRIVEGATVSEFDCSTNR